MAKEITSNGSLSADNQGITAKLRGVDQRTGLLKTEVEHKHWLPLVLMGWAAMLIFVGHACTRMVAAGDTWVAMACGRHFVTHGVDTVEPFSANSHHAGPTLQEIKSWPTWAKLMVKADPDEIDLNLEDVSRLKRALIPSFSLETIRYWHPTGWVNQNWLTHMIFYKLTTTLGSEEEPFYDALVYWKVGIYLLSIFCIYAIARFLKVHPALAATAACFALYVGRSFLDIRPAGFSNLMVSIFVLILTLATYRNIRYIWLIVPVTIFWGGVHGGYIYILIVMVPFIALHVFTTLPKRWTPWAYFCLGWLFLLFVTWKGLGFYRDIAPNVNTELVPALKSSTLKILALMVLLGIGGLVAIFAKQVEDRTLYISMAVASVLVFLLLRFSLIPSIPIQVTGRAYERLQGDLSGLCWNLFALFVAFMAFSSVFVFLKNHLVSLPRKAILQVIGAYAVALIASIVFNPFHLTNLTHTFIISVSKNAERWRDVHEWHPAFDWSNPVGTAKPFLILFIIALIVLVAWVVVQVWTYRQVALPALRRRGSEEKEAEAYPWPKLDIALVVVAGLTIYMAIRSRRFIPIAAFAGAPILAMLIQQVVNSIGVSRQYGLDKTLRVPRLPRQFERGILIATVVIVGGLAIFWGLKFKRVYLDPWPGDPKYHSIFMRMTASHLKPFEACKFLRLNHLSGNMMNYWTEGGAIAFGQEPDPNDGKTPLKLFMDGRAQAAYDRKAFDDWSLLWAGGEVGYEVRRNGRQATTEDYRRMGTWLDLRLKKKGVWVALVPQKEWTKYFTMGLEYAGNWQVAFMNNKQKLLVDVSTPQGKDLIIGIENGSTQYPDEFTRLFNVGYHRLLYSHTPEGKRAGFEDVLAAFKLNPSTIPMMALTNVAGRQAAFALEVVAFCRDYLEDFNKQMLLYKSEHGFQHRLDAAWRATAFLENHERKLKNIKAAEFFQLQRERYVIEMRSIGMEKRW